MINIGYLFKLLLLFAVICALIPLSPKMPMTDIDYSWAIALNQAVAQGLVFGQDIIFTLGPYSGLYTKVYHPATDPMIITSGLYIAFIYWLLCISVIKRHSLLLCIYFSIVLLGLVYARDVLFFSYPLLLGLWAVNHPGEENVSNLSHLSTFAFFSPLGLLMLVKGTFILQSILFLIFSTTYWMFNNKKLTVLISVLSVLMSLVFFWFMAHQPISALPAYITSSIKISMGFSESMSSEGRYDEIAIFLGISFIQLMFVVFNQQLPKRGRMFLSCALILFLFISFKAGFTRNQGHAFIASTAILFSGLMVSFIYHTRAVSLLIAISLAGCLFINGHHTKLSLTRNIKTTLAVSHHGIKNRMLEKNWPEENFHTLMNFVSGLKPLPHFNQTSDIYSYDQIYLIASGNNWSPRPIFQSYSAFSAELAEINKHKLQQNPPEHIFFRIQPIDNKLPSLDDGPSWRVLLNNYHSNESVSDYLILEKNHNERKSKLAERRIIQHHHLGEIVKVPNQSPLFFMHLTILPTIKGKLWSFLYHPDQLFIVLTLRDGSTRTFRISANMANSEFLLSPLVENTIEFGKLLHDPELMKDKTIKYFKIISLPENSKHWSNQYSLTFKVEKPLSY